jgi:hypothetical protein
MYTDEHLDFWGEFFTANRLHARGVRFDTFIEDPRAIARATIFRPRQDSFWIRIDEKGVADVCQEFRPLLPAQVRAITKPDARADENTCIGCGCTDRHGCVGEHGVCHWLRLDAGRRIGVCSECPGMVRAWDQARAATT